MEISGIIAYEKLFTLELLHPSTDAPIGVILQIRSSGSKEAKAIIRAHADDNLERSQKRKLIKGATLEKQEIEKAASFIASWNWGDNTWQGKVPDDSFKTKVEILDAEGWIFAQVVEAANSVANFTETSGKGSPKP